MTRRFSRRTGFSLLEVMVAATILMGSVIVLAQLANVGRHHVEAVETYTMAQLLCQSTLNELLAGLLPLEDVDPSPLLRDPRWLYSVEIRPVDNLPLARLSVTVTEDLESQADSMLVARKPKSHTLVRWIAQPPDEAGLGAPVAESPFTDGMPPDLEFGGEGGDFLP